jgi:ParB/RepB/Spo0J family partition protein
MNPNNLVILPDRLRTDMGDIESLAASIQRTGGLIQPIVVNENLEVVAGARRTMACQLLGIDAQVIIRDYGDEFEIEALENTQREPFPASDLGRWAHEHWNDQRQHGEVGATRDILAKRVGVSGVHLERCRKIYEAHLQGDTEILQIADTKGAVAAEKELKEQGGGKPRLASLQVLEGRPLDAYASVPAAQFDHVVTSVAHIAVHQDLIAEVFAVAERAVDEEKTVSIITGPESLSSLLAYPVEKWYVTAIDAISDKNQTAFAVSFSRVPTSTITSHTNISKGSPLAISTWLRTKTKPGSTILDPAAGRGAVTVGCDGMHVVAITEQREAFELHVSDLTVVDGQEAETE